MNKYVTAFNGARDNYSLPAALLEIDRLAIHVTDFYVSKTLAETVIAQRVNLSARNAADLPSSRTKIANRALIANLLVRLGAGRTTDPYLHVDRSLSEAAAALALRTGADLFLYSGYSYWAFRRLTHARRLMFQFHPHPAYVYKLLLEDVKRHPEVGHSFAREEDSQPLSNQRLERLEEWKLADRILCASTFTKKSLVEQGCDPRVVIVAPYGTDDFSDTVIIAPPHSSSASEKCRFLFVGQGVQRKGLHHLLKAWKMSPPANSELIVVSRRLDPGLRPLLDQVNVSFHSGMSRKSLVELYRSCDVFVMPSLVEGFGLVYGEALNHGLFCIGTSNTGLPDFNLTDREVDLIPVGDLGRLSQSMHSTSKKWADGELRRSSIKRASGNLTWASHRKQIQAFASA